MSLKDKIAKLIDIKRPNWTRGNPLPDVTIYREPGRVYLRRWWILPRNRLFNIYLHHFCQSDIDIALHDHPWCWASVILTHGYWEHTKKGRFWRKPFEPRFGLPRTFHRVELDKTGLVFRKSGNTWTNEQDVWTIFITGPRVHDWGFDCGKKGFVPWEKFVKKIPGGNQVGKGCED